MLQEKSIEIMEEQTRIFLALGLLTIVISLQGLPEIRTVAAEQIQSLVIIPVFIAVILGLYLLFMILAFVPEGTLGANYLRKFSSYAHKLYWLGSVSAIVYIAIIAAIKIFQEIGNAIKIAGIDDVILAILFFAATIFIVSILKKKNSN